MPTKSPKKSFKLNIPGLFKWESEEWTVKEIAIIIGMAMIFILILVGLLRLFIIPAWCGGIAIKQVSAGIMKIYKSRSP